MKNQEIVKPDNKKDLVVQQWGSEDLGYDNLIAQDLTVPRLLLIQPLSEMAQDERVGAKGGEIRESIEARLLGGTDKPIKFLPFFFTNTWVIRNQPIGSDQWEYVRSEERTAQNATLGWEFSENGIPYRREKTLILFGFLFDDVEAGKFVPYQVTFQRTSFTSAGKKFTQLMQLLKGAKRPLFSAVLDLTSEKQQNEKKQVYYIFNLALSKDSSGKEVSVSMEIQNQAYQSMLSVREAYTQGKIKNEEVVTNTASSEDIPF